MKEFLEQLGFKDIISYVKYPLTEYFDWNKPFHAIYRRYSDNGIITYIIHGIAGDKHWVDIISIYDTKWLKVHQLAPSEYIKEATFDLLTSTEARVLRL